jgi:MFS family permease
MAGRGYTANERRVLALTGVAHFATHFYELMYPTLAVALISETQLPLERVLGWSFAGYLLFGLGAFPAGLLTDRLGARPMLIGGLLAMGGAALAASWVSPGPTLALLLAVIGLGASVYHPAGMSLISHTVAARGRALGINGICGNLGIALTPVATATLAHAVGWRYAYLIVGATTCAVALACARVTIDEATIPQHGAVAADRSRDGNGVFFLVLCFTAAMAGISYRANTLAQPAYFAARVSLLDYGAVTSLVYLVGIGGQYAGGIWADRHDLRWLYLGFHALSIPALLLMSRSHELVLLAAAGWFVFFSLGMQPIENSLFARFTPPRWRATGYGIKFVLTFGVGSLAVPLVRWVTAGGEPRDVFLWAAGIVALLVAGVAVLIRLSAGQSIRHARLVEEAVA